MNRRIAVALLAVALVVIGLCGGCGDGGGSVIDRDPAAALQAAPREAR